MNKFLSKTIDNIDEGKTIKKLLKEDMKLSNRIIANLKNNKGILVNNYIENVNYILKDKDFLELIINDGLSENIIPEEMELNIIFEDDQLLIINKPAGLVVHPTTYYFTGTLANGVMYYLKEKGQHCKFRPVNRLDKDTSGLVLIAKTQIAHSILSEQLINKSFKKEYIAIVHNKFKKLEDTINAPIARLPGSIIKRHVSPDGQEAVTKYSILNQNDVAAVAKVNLITGRTHQIRVYFSFIGHPLFGDDLYGGQVDLIIRQALHCTKLEFIHPINKTIMNFNCPMADDIIMLCQKLNLVFM